MRYKNCTIEPSPRVPKFPDMVKIIKTTRKFSHLLNKQYVNQDKAISAIDTILAEEMIEKGRIKTLKELTELGIGDDIRW